MPLTAASELWTKYLEAVEGAQRSAMKERKKVVMEYTRSLIKEKKEAPLTRLWRRYACCTSHGYSLRTILQENSSDFDIQQDTNGREILPRTSWNAHL